MYICQYIFDRKKSRWTTPAPCQTFYFGKFMPAVFLHIYETHILQNTAHFRRIMLECRQWPSQDFWRPGRIITTAASKKFKVPQLSNPCTGVDRPLGLQGLEVPAVSRYSAHEGGKVVSPTHYPPLSPRKYSWYSFLLEAESIPGAEGGRKDCINEKFHNRESNPRPSGL
jgi:hypothetical protein